MDKRIELAITNYANEYLFPPEKSWPKYYFAMRSYSRWAAAEILDYIRDHQDISEIEAVGKFIDKMGEFSNADHPDRNDSFIFSIAYDVAVDILDMLSAME